MIDDMLRGFVVLEDHMTKQNYLEFDNAFCRNYHIDREMWETKILFL